MFKSQGPEVMNMYEEHAMTAMYMDAEMSHHGEPGANSEAYHPGLVIEQLNKVRSGSSVLMACSQPGFLAWLVSAPVIDGLGV